MTSIEADSGVVTQQHLIRDRDYVLDTHGAIFKIIGDHHPAHHYLGYVKYYPDRHGDRRLFGKTYRQNTVVAKSYGILADRPECYVLSEQLGCVITGLPRTDIMHHYSCQRGINQLYSHLEPCDGVSTDLKEIISYLHDRKLLHLFGITGSFLVGCNNKKSDIDLVCYGQQGYEAAGELFRSCDLITPYQGDSLTQLYLRRAKYMHGNDFSTLIQQESRKFQGLTRSGAHINCEPLRNVQQFSPPLPIVKEIGEVQLLARITDHSEGIMTPARYTIEVTHILSATIDEPHAFTPRITYLFSYLGAYTGAFCAGDNVYVAGKLVLVKHGDSHTFGVELTPWNNSAAHIASLLNA